MTVTVPPRGFAPPHHRVTADSRVVGGVLGRYAILAAGAIALGALHLRHRPSTICPFRALTGLPCPFCGGTTAASQLGHGNLRGALAASPLALVLLGIWPLVGALSPPHWWESPRLRIVTIVVILIASELWQMARFGIL